MGQAVGLDRIDTPYASGKMIARGEWGKLLGLDRIPEVRTLRQKLEILCRQTGLAMRWNTELAREWIAGLRESECCSLSMVMCGSITET